MLPESGSVELKVPIVELAGTFSLIELVDNTMSVGVLFGTEMLKIGLEPVKLVPPGFKSYVIVSLLFQFDIVEIAVIKVALVPVFGPI